MTQAEGYPSSTTFDNTLLRKCSILTRSRKPPDMSIQ